MSITPLSKDLQPAVIAVAAFGVPVAAVVGAVLLRVHQPRRILGPQRLSPVESATPLTFACGIGVFFWFAAIVCVSTFSAGGKPLKLEELTPAQMALLSTIPPAVGLMALLLGDMLVDWRLPGKLGLLRPQFSTLGQGLLGILIAYPIVFVVMETSELIYQRFHVVHPSEHELLKGLQDTHDPQIKGLLVVAAVVLAPLFEELLFRGHVQTLIKQVLIRFVRRLRGFPSRTPQPISPPISSAMTNPGIVDGTGLLMPPPLPEAAGFQHELPQGLEVVPAIPLEPAAMTPDRDLVWVTWLAVALTSVIFASFHDAWMRPGIFVLSMALGYVYERTGSMWANITMHLAFNTIGTVLIMLR